MQTQLCERLGIEFPIFAFSHCRDVVAAVTNAGGLGVLGATGFTEEEMEVELQWIDEQVGDRPYGVDVLIPEILADGSQASGGVADMQALIPEKHREFVNSLLDKYGVPPLAEGLHKDLPITVGPMLKHATSLVDVALEHSSVRFIASALGPPPQEMIDKARARDVVVGALVGTKRQALKQKAAGVDVIVAQGYEAGGHTGEIGTLVLVPEVVDAVAPIPVLAAGGIANGRQLAACLALGAQGVWCGSIWLTTHEAETHPVVKEKFLSATSSDTIRSRATTGKPARQLKSAWTEEWDSPDTPSPLPMPLQTLLFQEAKERIEASAHHNAGAEKLINFYVGQGVGMAEKIKPAKQVVYELAEECAETLSMLAE